jgi:hypothetical protein
LPKPTARFPEDVNSSREGITLKEDIDQARGVPVNLCRTEMSKKELAPELLDLYQLRYEVHEEYIVILQYVNDEGKKQFTDNSNILRGEFL